jgi:hypothetical protein
MRACWSARTFQARIVGRSRMSQIAQARALKIWDKFVWFATFAKSNMGVNVRLPFLDIFEGKRVSDLRRSQCIVLRTQAFQSSRLSNLRRSGSTGLCFVSQECVPESYSNGPDPTYRTYSTDNCSRKPRGTKSDQFLLFKLWLFDQFINLMNSNLYVSGPNYFLQSIPFPFAIFHFAFDIWWNQDVEIYSRCVHSQDLKICRC